MKGNLLTRIGLLSTFSEYSTFVAACFFIFSFVTGGELARVVLYMIGRILTTLAESDLLFGNLLFGGFLLIIIIGFALSLYHPFSTRAVASLEARGMMVFAASITVWAAASVYLPLLDSPEFIQNDADIAMILATVYFIVSLMTFQFILEDRNFQELWMDNQLTVRMALLLILVIAGIGAYAVNQHWHDHLTYQVMLTVALVIATAVRLTLPPREAVPVPPKKRLAHTFKI